MLCRVVIVNVLAFNQFFDKTLIVEEADGFEQFVCIICCMVQCARTKLESPR